MGAPRIHMDFNGYALDSWYTLEDIERQGIKLGPGMRCVFYEFDCEDGVYGLLHTSGKVWWNAERECFMLDMRTVNFQFTPGNDISILDALYPDTV